MRTQTWLPVFSGFYNTIWEPDTTREVEYINEQRYAKGLSPITDNDCFWDNKKYEQRIAEKVTTEVGEYLKEKGFVAGYKFESLSSPKEYNFRNDSINVTFVISKLNEA